ncbi:MAG: hypothetical protein IT320_14220 [Anaerolineae bacterium]|nr:hypothetical protein [Anaerolineae bacterium]
MNYETYFPEQRHLLPLTIFRRDRLLPVDATGGIEVARGDRVDLHTVVARGAVQAPFTIVEAARQLRLRRPEQLDDLLHVHVGDPVQQGELLAGKNGRRKRGVRSPITGTVVHIGDGRVILQEVGENMVVEAGVNGHVVDIRRGRGALVEGIGAVLQGVWGNNSRATGTLRLEPSDGFGRISREALDSPYHNAIVVTRRPLSQSTLQVVHEQELLGVIAPSIEPELMNDALSSSAAILLTEGFGSQRMSTFSYSFLSNLEGRQATLDGIQPGVLEARRPEVIVNVPLQSGERPPAPRNDLTLHTDMQVRVTRGNFAGNIGQIIGLLNNPIVLDNGLRVHVAQVYLVTGETLYVPLENLEVFG